MTTRSELLQQRLIEFGIKACELARRLPHDAPGTNLARQLSRSALAPAANYAEARDAESGHDYAHKVKVCVKELRETAVWLAAAKRLGRTDPRAVAALEKECNELTAILVTCLKKARAKHVG